MIPVEFYVTRSKVRFISGESDIADTFNELQVPPEILPVRYGGIIEDEITIPVPGYPPIIENEVDAAARVEAKAGLVEEEEGAALL